MNKLFLLVGDKLLLGLTFLALIFVILVIQEAWVSRDSCCWGCENHREGILSKIIRCFLS